jgi:uncharacterized protein
MKRFPKIVERIAGCAILLTMIGAVVMIVGHPRNKDLRVGMSAKLPGDHCDRVRFRLSTCLHERSFGEDRFSTSYSACPTLLVVTRFVWPLHLPPSVKFVAAVLLLVASQYHLWSRLSSGSVFAPEFPRPVVILFNWAFGAIIFLALLQLLLDTGTLLAMAVHGGGVNMPDCVRYAMGTIAAVLAAIGVHQAVRVPPVKDIEIGIPGLTSQFDGYKVLQLTDLHVSRLFPAPWTRAVVERANSLGAGLIVVTGDLIDGTLAARRADVEPLRALRAPDGV